MTARLVFALGLFCGAIGMLGALLLLTMANDMAVRMGRDAERAHAAQGDRP